MVVEVVMLIEMMGDEVGEEADGSAKEEGLVSVMVVVTSKVFVEMMVYVRLWVTRPQALGLSSEHSQGTKDSQKSKGPMGLYLEVGEDI